MRLVILDTNATWTDVLLQSKTSTAFLRARKDEDFEVIVPAIVVAEVTKQYPDRAREAIGKFEKATSELGHFGIDVGAAEPAVDPDFEATYRRRLRELEIEIAPAPDPSEAIRWSVERRKPFKGNRAGLPDALIWSTVLDHAASFEEVVLVTSNRNDFCDDGSATALATALREDLKARGLGPERVRILPTIRDLIPSTPGAYARALALL
jgi:hypothetical protein